MSASASASTAESNDGRQAPPDEIQRRSRFLISASAALSESLDYERTLQRVAELSVPDMADWCTVTIVDERGRVRRLAVVHADPGKRDLVAEYQSKFPPAEHRAGQMGEVLRRGRAALSVHVSDEDLINAAQTEDHLPIAESAMRAADELVIPVAPTLIEVNRTSPMLTNIANVNALRARPVRASIMLNRTVAQANSTEEARDALTGLGFDVLAAPVPRLELFAQSFGNPVYATGTVWADIAAELLRREGITP